MIRRNKRAINLRLFDKKNLHIIEIKLCCSKIVIYKLEIYDIFLKQNILTFFIF